MPTSISRRQTNPDNHSQPLKNANTKIKKNTTKWKKECISRESNAGPIDGNDGFYHSVKGRRCFVHREHDTFLVWNSMRLF
ncbi:hypothetical protein F4781DRAFT_50401 [Annulohypoxylon bovei var. microspora]|nr:hypothetical protein F4781DRAFT_50401 [Annulohypoxylon bovei var. microspora]